MWCGRDVVSNGWTDGYVLIDFLQGGTLIGERVECRRTCIDATLTERSGFCERCGRCP